MLPITNIFKYRTRGIVSKSEKRQTRGSGPVDIQVVALVLQDWFRFRCVRRKDMLAYSTTNRPEDGPIL
jgi:hypothetical protein